MPARAGVITLAEGVLAGSWRRLAGGRRTTAKKEGNVGRTILLVENEDDIRSVLSALLQREGYDVVEAGDGEAALTVASTHPPDAVLMDLAMPEMNGLDAARHLRARTGTAGVPLLAMTASTWFANDPDLVRTAGFDVVLTKPFAPDAVLAHLRRLLPGSPAAH